MIIVEDESKRGYGEGMCENCGETKPIRAIKTTGNFKENRGTFIICFKGWSPD